jgi:hypothetical protein
MEGTNPASASKQYQKDASGLSEYGPEANQASDSTTPAGASMPMPPQSVEITVEDLLSLSVPLSWQEAAAIVVEFVSVAPLGGSWPDPAHAILTDSGEIVPALQVTLGGDPVCHAAELLERLLALTRLAPAELKVLVNKNLSAPPAHASLEAFGKSLNHFTRPTRLDDTAVVHGRAADLLQKRLLEREFDRVRHKSVLAGADAGEDEEGRRPSVLGVPSQWVQGAVVVLLCLLLMSSGTVLVSMALWPGPLPWWPYQPTGSVSAASRPDLNDAPGAAELNGPTVAPGRVPARPSSPAPSSTSEARLSRSPQLRTPALAPRGSSAPAPPASGGSTADPARDRFWSVTVREVTPDAAFAASLATPTLSHERSRELFSPLDPDVEPATLVRPQMPTSRTPSGPDQRDSVFDLIIDQKGRVEQVHLVSPANRFNDRMLIAAAKAWQFLPAIKDGQPVRYKLQVRISP